MIEAKVIEDTISPWGVRLTTMEVEIWRPTLAEFNTHRLFSRSSASSRAIPVSKTLTRVMDDPAWPYVWASEQKGMSGGAPLDGSELFEAQRLFHDIHEYMTRRIGSYIDHNPLTDDRRRLHKSLINRLMETFMWHRVIVTTVEAENFWRQRCDKSAMPEMRIAAEHMLGAMLDSTPRELSYGDWHMPYIQPEDWHAIYGRDGHHQLAEVIEGCVNPDAVELAKKISTARCARVSYLNHDGVRDIREDIRMFDETLMAANPKHWAPLEHIATPLAPGARSISGWEQEMLWQAVESGAAKLRHELGSGLRVTFPGYVVNGALPDQVANWLDGQLVVPGNFAPGFLQLRHAVACA